MKLSELSDRMAGLGQPLGITGLSKIENGKRGVELDELVALARALDVPPLLLIFPLGHEQAIEVLPSVTMGTWDAAAWFTGEAQPPEGYIDLEDQPTFYFREQSHLTSEWLRVRDDAALADVRDQLLRSTEERLRVYRKIMRSKGLDPGPLLTELAHIDGGDRGQR